MQADTAAFEVEWVVDKYMYYSNSNNACSTHHARGETHDRAVVKITNQTAKQERLDYPGIVLLLHEGQGHEIKRGPLLILREGRERKNKNGNESD